MTAKRCLVVGEDNYDARGGTTRRHIDDIVVSDEWRTHNPQPQPMTAKRCLVVGEDNYDARGGTTRRHIDAIVVSYEWRTRRTTTKMKSAEAIKAANKKTTNNNDRRRRCAHPPTHQVGVLPFDTTIHK